MARAELYQITIWLRVMDARALKRAATELAEAIGMSEWEVSCGTDEDQLLMLLDPGTLPGVHIIETSISRHLRTHSELPRIAQSRHD
jgi:hypothetical protein